jgi:glycosyltransferase involved in cell wall biosynthesis
LSFALNITGILVTTPLVSVIVPAWNSGGLIRRCLDALQSQSIPPEQFEIIVVDNASTDGTADIVRSVPGVRLLVEHRPGSYAARNRGLAHARGTYVAFTDADCLPAPDWLEAAVSAAGRHPDAGVLAGRINLFEEGDSEDPAFADYERLFSFPQSFASRGNCATANWMSRRSLFDELGGFDETLKSGGDREMALRIKAAGLPLIYVPEMAVYHPVRATRESLVRKRRRLSGGRWDRTAASARMARVLGVTLHDTVRRLRRVLLTPGLSIRRKLAVMRLTVELSLVATFEFWRLYRGHDTVRG